MKTSDKYLKIVQWSKEDQCYVGQCPDLMLGGVHGCDEKQVYAELCDAVEEWIQIHQDDGIPIPPSTHNKDYQKWILKIRNRTSSIQKGAPSAPKAQ